MSRDGPLSHLLRPLRNGLNYKVNTSRARQWRRDYTHASVIEKPGLSILTEHFEGYHPDAEFNDANRANTHEYLRVASGAIPLFALEKLVAVLVKDGYIFYEAKNYGFDETYNCAYHPNNMECSEEWLNWIDNEILSGIAEHGQLYAKDRYIRLPLSLQNRMQDDFYNPLHYDTSDFDATGIQLFRPVLAESNWYTIENRPWTPGSLIKPSLIMLEAADSAPTSRYMPAAELEYGSLDLQDVLASIDVSDGGMLNAGDIPVAPPDWYIVSPPAGAPARPGRNRSPVVVPKNRMVPGERAKKKQAKKGSKNKKAADSDNALSELSEWDETAGVVVERVKTVRKGSGKSNTLVTRSGAANTASKASSKPVLAKSGKKAKKANKVVTRSEAALKAGVSKNGSKPVVKSSSQIPSDSDELLQSPGKALTVNGGFAKRKAAVASPRRTPAKAQNVTGRRQTRIKPIQYTAAFRSESPLTGEESDQSRGSVRHKTAHPTPKKGCSVPGQGGNALDSAMEALNDELLQQFAEEEEQEERDNMMGEGEQEEVLEQDWENAG